MSSSDFCRFCNTNMRVKGVLSNTALIFETTRSSNDKSVFARLEDIGCHLLKDDTKSTRMCRSCLRLLQRMEGDFQTLRKWQDQETEELEELSSLKRQRDTPSRTPRSTKKQRHSAVPGPSTQMPSRQSITEVSATLNFNTIHLKQIK